MAFTYSTLAFVTKWIDGDSTVVIGAGSGQVPQSEVEAIENFWHLQVFNLLRPGWSNIPSGDAWLQNIIGQLTAASVIDSKTGTRGSGGATTYAERLKLLALQAIRSKLRNQPRETITGANKARLSDFQAAILASSITLPEFRDIES